MVNLGAKSKRAPSAVIREAVAFFGRDGLGLEVRDRSDTTIEFIGGGVVVLVSAAPKARGSDVSVVSQEWDHQAKQFLTRL